MDHSTDVAREHAINDLTRRMREHVCAGFAILEAFERLQDERAPSRSPAIRDDKAITSRSKTTHGWIAAGY